MRKINLIVVHCTATPAGRNVSAADVDRWHRQRGFRSIGYHFLVRLDGYIEAGRPLDEIGAHALGHNADSIGVAYAGGLDSAGRPADTRTPAQKQALQKLLQSLRKQFPNARIVGHNTLAAKACPCFNAEEEYGRL